MNVKNEDISYRYPKLEKVIFHKTLKDVYFYITVKAKANVPLYFEIKRVFYKAMLP